MTFKLPIDRALCVAICAMLMTAAALNGYAAGDPAWNRCNSVLVDLSKPISTESGKFWVRQQSRGEFSESLLQINVVLQGRSEGLQVLVGAPMQGAECDVSVTTVSYEAKSCAALAGSPRYKDFSVDWQQSGAFVLSQRKPSPSITATLLRAGEGSMVVEGALFAPSPRQPAGGGGALSPGGK